MKITMLRASSNEVMGLVGSRREWMNVLLYLKTSTQLLLLFLNGRTGRQPHDDDDDVLLAQVLLYRYDKPRRGRGATDKKKVTTHHSLTSHSAAAHLS